MTTELVELAKKWQDEAAGTWGESVEHATLQRCSDELRALASRAGVPDGRELLAKYMRYVGDVEGIDYVSSGYRGYSGDQTFTPEEWAELARISDEVNGPAAPEPLAVGSNNLSNDEEESP
jgi:hypothetical protein